MAIVFMERKLLSLANFYAHMEPVSTGYPLIRVGGKTDGSYLLPDVLGGIELCLSPGTAGIIDFELQLGNVYGIPSLLCDPTEDAPPALPDFLRFDRTALSSVTGNGKITMSDWMSKYGYTDTTPLILSMDIEGAELEVIMGFTDIQLASIRMATIEFTIYTLFTILKI